MNIFFTLLLTLVIFSCSTTTVEYRSATTALYTDKPEEAEKYALDALEKHPNDALPAFFLATKIYGIHNTQYPSVKNVTKAVEYYYKAQDIITKSEDGSSQKLETPLKYRENDKVVQIKTIEKALDYYSYDFWLMLFNEATDIIISNGDIEMAVELYKQSISFNSTNMKTYETLAYIFYDKGEYEESKTFINAAMDIETTSAPLHRLCGHIAMQEEDDILAEEMLRTAYDLAVADNLDTDGLSPYMESLFDILIKIGQTEEAMQIINQLIESDDENIILLQNAGSIYQEMSESKFIEANAAYTSLSSLTTQPTEFQLMEIKEKFENANHLATEARNKYLIASTLAEDADQIEEYKSVAKSIKQRIRMTTSNYIIKLNKQIDELE